MNRLTRNLQFPLLKKELSELAARRQTYVIRLGYAAILFAVACILFYGTVSGSVLGRGRSMFVQLVELQFCGIYALLPAMVCGVISSEKERDSLCLLTLSTLSPWQIVFQKLFSRLIPMFSFQFISFPLMAIAFSNGGVTTGHLWVGILLLVLTCVQVGSFAIACSAFFRTTNEAFVASYLGLLVLNYVMPALFAQNAFHDANRLAAGRAFVAVLERRVGRCLPGACTGISGFSSVGSATELPSGVVSETGSRLYRCEPGHGRVVLAQDTNKLQCLIRLHGVKHRKNHWGLCDTCFASWLFWRSRCCVRFS